MVIIKRLDLGLSGSKNGATSVIILMAHGDYQASGLSGSKNGATSVILRVN